MMTTKGPQDGPRRPQDGAKMEDDSKKPQHEQKPSFSLSFLYTKKCLPKSAENRPPATPLPAPSPVVAYAFKKKLHLAGRSLSVIRRGLRPYVRPPKPPLGGRRTKRTLGLSPYWVSTCGPNLDFPRAEIHSQFIKKISSNRRLFFNLKGGVLPGSLF